MVWRFLKKLGTKRPYDPAIPLLGIYSEETKIEKDTCITLLTAALFIIARTWKQHKCPSTEEWIKRMWNIHTVEYYSAMYRNKIMYIHTVEYYSTIYRNKIMSSAEMLNGTRDGHVK